MTTTGPGNDGVRPSPWFVLALLLTLAAAAFNALMVGLMALRLESLLPGVFAMAVFGDQLLNALQEETQVNYWLVAAAAIGLGAFLYFARRWAVKYATP